MSDAAICHQDQRAIVGLEREAHVGLIHTVRTHQQPVATRLRDDAAGETRALERASRNWDDATHAKRRRSQFLERVERHADREEQPRSQLADRRVVRLLCTLESHVLGTCDRLIAMAN
jgi:hypothetical protein